MQISKNRSRQLVWGSSVFVILGSVVTAHAQPSVAYRYNFVKLDYPGAAVSFPLGINTRREIVGVHVDSQGVNHGYLYRGGVFTNIDYPGASAIPGGGTSTGGINDRGDIAGLYTDNDGYQHGFLRALPDNCTSDMTPQCKAVFRTINVPGAARIKNIPFETGTGLGTAALGVNNHQDVVGLYASPQLYSLGFKLSFGTFTTIDDPAAGHNPGLGSRLFGINDYGVVAGASATQATPASDPISHGFIFDGRNYTAINVPGADAGGFGTQVNGINNSQEVVGVYTDPYGQFHGLLWMGGQPFSLDFPGVLYSENHCINARGDITGAYVIDFSGFNYRGFVAYLKDR